MRVRFAVAAAVLTSGLLVPASGEGQAVAFHPEVARARFAFFERQLTVAVHVDGPGALRLLRGSRGELRATGRAPRGVVDFGLDRERRRLHLGGVGGSSSEFLVVVPADASVRVLLPGWTRPGSFEPPVPSATCVWGPEDAAVPTPPTEEGEPFPQPRCDGVVPPPGRSLR